jgi:hypothetical protein
MRCLCLCVLLSLFIAACGDDSSDTPPSSDQGGIPDQFVDGSVDTTFDTVPGDLTVDFFDDLVITDMTVDSGLIPDTTPPPDTGVVSDLPAPVDGGPAPDTTPTADSGPAADTMAPDSMAPDTVPHAQCGGTASVVLQEMSTGDPDYLTLKNTGGAQADISGFRLEMDGISPESYTFPASTTIAAGETVYVFEWDYGTEAGDINTDVNFPFYNETFSNSAALWDDADNLLDYMAVGNDLPGLPVGVNTAPVPWPAGHDSTTHSLQRVAYTGSCPTFNASDWAGQPITRAP